MGVNKNEILKIGDGIYQIKYYWLGLANVYCFLIVGEKRALMIDSAYSTTHAIDYAKTVTDLPIDLVNTHGHFDHIGGNAEFENVYMSQADLNVAKLHSDEPTLKNMLEDYRKKAGVVGWILKLPHLKKQMRASIKIAPCEYKPLPSKGYFDLGGRKVSFLHTPGHTPGSICLMDDKTGYFFTGDMACQEGVLLGFDYAESVSGYRRSVQKMKDYYKTNGGTKIIPSHHTLPAREDVFDRLIALCDKIISGELVGKAHDDGLSSGWMASEDEVTIIYRKI